MFWDDKDDSESWQIFKNLGFLNMPFNNKDRDEVFNSPIFGIIMVLVIIGVILFAIFA